MSQTALWPPHNNYLTKIPHVNNSKAINHNIFITLLKDSSGANIEL